MCNIYEHEDVPTLYVPKSSIKLASSASEHNSFLTYVCLISDVKPTSSNTTKSNLFGKEIDDNEEKLIKVDRTKAVHELVDIRKNLNNTATVTSNKDENGSSSTYTPTTSEEDSDISEIEAGNGNPNILKLTKMKWLTESRDASPEPGFGNLSTTNSATSSDCSRESDECGLDDKYLTTILKLDREHNLFGLSNITIVGAKPSRKSRKDEGPVFPQTAIVQVCCSTKCCKHRSKSDLPASLKCSRCCMPCITTCSRCCPKPCRPCRGCPTPCPATKPSPQCPSSIPPCLAACAPPPCPLPLRCRPPPPCPNMCRKLPCSVPCSPMPCPVSSRSSPKCSYKVRPKCKPCFDPCSCFGLSVRIKRKEPKPKPVYKEITPRNSCILSKPMMARACEHTPPCVPPTPCFPCYSTCYWPARAGAPCTNPSQCFHNPPCGTKPAESKPRKSRSSPRSSTSSKTEVKAAPDKHSPPATDKQKPVDGRNKPDKKKQAKSKKRASSKDSPKKKRSSDEMYDDYTF